MSVHRCPDCRCADDERPPQPSTSSAWARRQAKEATAEAVRQAREKRTAPCGDTTATDTRRQGQEAGR